ncbi:MAG: HIT domain-containing protein [Thermoproteota archaeon]
MCIFCHIVEGKEEAYVLYSNSKAIAILDKFPIAPGHTLVISKDHYSNFLETPENILYELIAACKLVAKAVIKAVKADGVRIFTNVGRSSMQVIFHIHFHILPSWEKGYPEEFNDFKSRSLQSKTYYENLKSNIISNLKMIIDNNS